MKTDTQTTPGPWYRMDRLYDVSERSKIEICTFRDDGYPDQFIARINECVIDPTLSLDEHHPEVEANARLIAAAPELRDALRDMVSTFIATQRDCDEWASFSRAQAILSEL